MALISCLLATCAPEMGVGIGGASTEDTSDTSSVEILKALTVHLASPAAHQMPDSGGAASGVGAGRPKSGAGRTTGKPGTGYGLQKPGVVVNDADNVRVWLVFANGSHFTVVFHIPRILPSTSSTN